MIAFTVSNEGNCFLNMLKSAAKLANTGKLLQSHCIGLSRYIAITNLSIIAVFLEYLRQFLIDLNQTYTGIVVCQKTRLREFLELFTSSGFRARRRRDFFFVTLCVSRCSESAVSALSNTSQRSVYN